MRSKNLLTAILSLFISAALFTSVTLAATEATVTATVTAQNVSISLTTDGSVAFGTINTSSTKDTTSSGVDDTETLQNNGNVNEDIDIKAANSTSSGAGWTLGPAAGSETYTMKFCTTNCDSSPSWTSVGVNPSYQDLVDPLSASGSQSFDLQVGTPTSTTDYNQQSITVTILASAS